MKSIIKGQITILAFLLTAFAVTLTACGGGSSSSGGGAGSTNMASVSGTVTNNGVASLDSQGQSNLFAALSDALISPAHATAVAGVSVVVDCGSGAVYEGVTDGNGYFKIMVSNVENGLCTISFNGALSRLHLVDGRATEIEVILNGGSVTVTVLSTDQGSEGIASVDDASSDDGSSDDSHSDADSDSDSDNDSA